MCPEPAPVAIKKDPFRIVDVFSTDGRVIGSYHRDGGYFVAETCWGEVSGLYPKELAVEVVRETDKRKRSLEGK